MVLVQPLKLWFGLPSSNKSPMRFTASLRIEAVANTITPMVGSTNGNDVEGGYETGDLADEAEVFECFHGDRDPVSTVRLNFRTMPDEIGYIAVGGYFICFSILEIVASICSRVDELRVTMGFISSRFF